MVDYFYAHTPGGNLRQININPNWEHHKQQMRERLKDHDETRAIYALRKIDDEPFLGNLKSNLKYLRTSIRGIEKFITEAGIALMTANLLAAYLELIFQTGLHS
ncbi:transposase [Lactobacillus sp. CC-MHH1034]|nr:transposase [Agrilactobacillus fermenti]